MRHLPSRMIASNRANAPAPLLVCHGSPQRSNRACRLCLLGFAWGQSRAYTSCPGYNISLSLFCLFQSSDGCDPSGCVAGERRVLLRRWVQRRAQATVNGDTQARTLKTMNEVIGRPGTSAPPSALRRMRASVRGPGIEGKPHENMAGVGTDERKDRPPLREGFLSPHLSEAGAMTRM